MKRYLTAILIFIMIFSLAACGGTAGTEQSAENTTGETVSADPANDEVLEPFASAEDITPEALMKRTIPTLLVNTTGRFRMTRLYENTGDALFEGSVSNTVFEKNGNIIEISENLVYADGYTNNMYFSNDPGDANFYMVQDAGSEVTPLEDGYADAYLRESLMNYAPEYTTITEVKEEGDSYVATVQNNTEGTENEDIVTIDKSTGLITSVVSSYASVKGEGSTTCTSTFEYEGDFSVDRSARETSGGAAEASSAAGNAGTVDLTTEDINGNPVNNDLIKDAKLVLCNFWEPWCGPCVGEMPDLQALYEKYRDKGLVILGAYASTEYQDDAEAIVSKNHITYPILKVNDSLMALEQDYVPATYLMDGQGCLLSEEPIAGAQSYEEWEKLIQKYLQ